MVGLPCSVSPDGLNRLVSVLPEITGPVQRSTYVQRNRWSGTVSPMTVPAATVAQVMEVTRGWKETWVSNGGWADKTDVHRYDILPTGMAIRDGQKVLEFHAPDMDRVVRGLEIAAHGTGADRIILVSDAYMPTPKFFEERDVATLRPGDVEKLFESGRHDLARETVVAMWADKEGPSWMVSQGYRIVDGPKVEWTTDPGDGEVRSGDAMGGVPVVMRSIMAADNDLLLQAELQGLIPNALESPSLARTAGDIATAKLLAEHVGVSVTMGTQNPEEAAIFQAVLDSPNFNAHRPDDVE